ncbi:MAG: 2-oxoacid:acceptor oxidoreductase family protein, partial [Acidobacteriota bacterium]
MEPLEIRVSGLGGQGVILAGYIIGKAASIYDGKEATMAQAYGPEARGSACSSQVIISGATIHYPYVTEPGVLVCMSQEAQDKFAKEVKPGGIVLIDETLVKE